MVAQAAQEPIEPWLRIGGKAEEVLLSTLPGRETVFGPVSPTVSAGAALAVNDASCPIGANIIELEETWDLPFFCRSVLILCKARLFRLTFWIIGKFCFIQAVWAAVGAFSPVPKVSPAADTTLIGKATSSKVMMTEILSDTRGIRIMFVSLSANAFQTTDKKIMVWW